MRVVRLRPGQEAPGSLDDFLQCIGRARAALAIQARRINEIVLGKRSVSVDTALRLARYFGTSPQLWLGLQMDFDLDVATDAMESRLKREVKPYARVSR